VWRHGSVSDVVTELSLDRHDLFTMFGDHCPNLLLECLRGPPSTVSDPLPLPHLEVPERYRFRAVLLALFPPLPISGRRRPTFLPPGITYMDSLSTPFLPGFGKNRAEYPNINPKLSLVVEPLLAVSDHVSFFFDGGEE